jgi:diguanylate cyclase (GGDEF)-like protein/PAS domain S-box-containing protein
MIDIETGATVLVIDDDAMVRLLCTEALVDAGHRVIEAGSAEAGLALFDELPADLVLLDLVLPGMNGYAACARLRAHPAGEHVPIIVMTGLDDRQSIVDAYDAGATDFITKPIVWDLLPFRVRYALRASQALRDSVRTQALLANSQRIAHMGSWEWSRVRDTLTCSDEFMRIHGGTPGPAMLQPNALLALVHPQDRESVARSLDAARQEGRAYSIEFRIVRPDGTLRHLFEQTDVERDSGGGVVAVRGIRHDITEQAETARRMHSLAYIDSLTGLANRALFRDMVQQWLPYAERRSLCCAVVLVNLDRFKFINDSLGTGVGDQVLKVVSERLRTCIRAEDPKAMVGDNQAQEPLARLGADEFSLFLVDIGTPEQALRVVQRLSETLALPIPVEGQQLNVSASIGVAMSPGDGNDTDTLLRNASTAVHAAKEEGRQQVRLYSRSMGEQLRRRHALETELRRALEHNELRVFYQAKVDARSSRVVGAEALVRWMHPQRGMVNPAEFIPMAEESGLIVPITHWVVDNVCAQLAAWSRARQAWVPVSVNLDGKSLLSEGLVERVGAAIARHGIDCSMVEFEVTESGLMKDLERSAQVLRRLKQLGVRLAIDDFGTGYSSLTYLKRFPLDILKIDRSFIKDLPGDMNDAALTSAIVAMAKSLNLELIAEGVETWAQADFLMHKGCELIQGFLFSRPISSEAFAQLLIQGVASRPDVLALPLAP